MSPGPIGGTLEWLKILSNIHGEIRISNQLLRESNRRSKNLSLMIFDSEVHQPAAFLRNVALRTVAFAGLTIDSMVRLHTCIQGVKTPRVLSDL